MIHFGRPDECRVDADVFLPVETNVRERHFDQLLDRMRDSRGDDVIVGRVLLQHQPHRVHVVAGKAPVAAGVAIAEFQRIADPELDAGHAVGDLAGDELDAAPRRFVIEENA